MRHAQPDAVCFGGNYLANVPEITDIGEAIKRCGIREDYYLETRGDVLLRNLEKPVACGVANDTAIAGIL